MGSKDFLILAVLTFLTVVAWIISEAYHAAVTSTVTVVEKRLMEPLQPTFNQQVIKALKETNEL